MPLQTFRYAACGGFNTMLDISLFYVLMNFVLPRPLVHLPYVVMETHIAAFLLAFAVTFPVGFYLSRYVVWESTDTKKRVQLFRYMLVVAACIVLNYLFLKLFVTKLGWWPTIGKVVTTIFVVAFSYVAQRNFSFKSVNK